jgi:nicotinamide-nucleotide amidase
MAFSKKKPLSMDVRSSAPSCEIITIGTELLLGKIMDTNTNYLSQELGRVGVAVRFRTSVGDRIEEITQVIANAIKRCDMVITTGGLGPTLDDLTREAVAQVAKVELEFRQELMEQIQVLFGRAGYEMPENNRRQAFVPAGSHAIPNPVGTAPGFIKEIDARPIICLPGVPKELTYLLGREAIPWIQQRFALGDHVITYKVLKVVGVGESRVDRLIGDLIAPGQDPEVGLLASQGEIKVRIAARGKDISEARALIGPVEKEIRSRLGKKILGEDEDTLEGVVNSLLARRGLTLAVLETFSGGLAAQKLYQIPSTQLVNSRVIPDKARISQWLGQGTLTMEPQEVMVIAQKVRDSGQAKIGLAIIGFPAKQDEVDALDCRTAVAGEGFEKTFFWTMGGDLFTLQQRGAVIGLNTLRLALLEPGCG